MRNALAVWGAFGCAYRALVFAERLHQMIEVHAGPSPRTDPKWGGYPRQEPEWRSQRLPWQLRARKRYACVHDKESADGGRTWRPYGLPGAVIRDLAFVPAVQR